MVRDERGASAIEFALLAPVLLALLIGTVTLFDLFRNAQNVEKATFTVGDMISRQSSVSTAWLQSMLTLMQKVVPSASDGGLRVSSFVGTSSGLQLSWTKTAGTVNSSVPVPSGILPTIAVGDTVVLTESFVPHQAMVAGFGIDQFTYSTRAVHRPRFVKSISSTN